MKTPGSGWLSWMLVAAALTGALGVGERTLAAELEPLGSEPAGTYGGVEYARHVGRVVGVTSQGVYRMPYEIIAPVDPSLGNGRVVVEPSHFFFGPSGREGILGRGFLFGQGFSHAAVGFGEFGMNILDPAATDLVLAGNPVPAPPFLGRDVEILDQFTRLLSTDPTAEAILGLVEARYAFGVSQSAEAWYEVMYGVGAAGLFDLTVLYVPLWRPSFADPRVLATVPEDFEPLSGIGRVMLVSAEGDLFISESMELRAATASPDYRLWEVAGAPHLPLPIPANPLDAEPVVRAAFVAGHQWVAEGENPPDNRLLAEAAPGAIDPVYQVSTGIARDVNLNALGGVRLPDVSLGRAMFIASIPVPLPGFPQLVGLAGAWFDLACAPAPGDPSGGPRFRNHGGYVAGVGHEANSLVAEGYLLQEDAEVMKEAAAESAVGKPGSCP